MIALAFAFALCGTFRAAADPVIVSFDYSSTAGAYIRFDGHSHFGFGPTSDNFQITLGGTAAGMMGEITGTYSIGGVTRTGSMYSAPVTGTGTFVVHDRAGSDLTGTLTWLNILQYGTGDFLNTSGDVNLNRITYSGIDSTLASLASGPRDATNVLSFQFLPARSLAKLKSAPAITSFSGSVYAFRSVPDNGNALLLLGTALLVLSLAKQRRRESRVQE